MIDVNSVQHAVYALITSHYASIGSNATVNKNVPLNSDMNKLPWIGVYVPEVMIEPYHAQVDNPWQAIYNISVYVQHGSRASAQMAFDNVQRALTAALNGIDGDRTLMGTVQHISGWEISPFGWEPDQEDNLVTYLVQIRAEKFV